MPEVGFVCACVCVFESVCSDIVRLKGCFLCEHHYLMHIDSSIDESTAVAVR